MQTLQSYVYCGEPSVTAENAGRPQICMDRLDRGDANGGADWAKTGLEAHKVAHPNLRGIASSLGLQTWQSPQALSAFAGEPHIAGLLYKITRRTGMHAEHRVPPFSTTGHSSGAM